MDRRTLFKGLLALTVVGQVEAAEPTSGRGAEPVADPVPLDNELEKYPRCVVCNMDRRRFHYARHLTHYADDHVDGTCSLECTAEMMLRERRRGFKAIYGPDFGAEGEPKPLVDVAAATYLLGSRLPGTMTRRSKYVFADPVAAQRVRQEQGGELATFDEALAASMAEKAEQLGRRYRNDQERLRRKKDGAAS